MEQRLKVCFIIAVKIHLDSFISILYDSSFDNKCLPPSTRGIFKFESIHSGATLSVIIGIATSLPSERGRETLSARENHEIEPRKSV